MRELNEGERYVADELWGIARRLGKLKREYRNHIPFNYEFERHLTIADTVLNIEWSNLVNKKEKNANG